MRFLIVEDDIVWQLKIQMILEQLGYSDYMVLSSITEFEEIIKIFRPDLIIGDICLSDGMLLDNTDNIFNEIPTIFITGIANPEFMEKSICYRNSIFLMKPVHPLTLQGAIKSLINTVIIPLIKEIKYIKVRGKFGNKINLNIEQITYLHADGNYVEILHENKKYILKTSLKKIASELNNNFMQVHKSYLINKDFISFVNLKELIIQVGLVNIPIGKVFKEAVMDSLQQ